MNLKDIENLLELSTRVLVKYEREAAGSKRLKEAGQSIQAQKHLKEAIKKVQQMQLEMI